MRIHRLHLSRSFSTALAAVLTLLALGGCQTMPPPPAPSEMQLLEAAPLALPRDCTASGSYIVSFIVEPSGRTKAIRADNAPTCIEQALHAWVESFRYAPLRETTAASVEWMMVTAKRGS